VILSFLAIPIGVGGILLRRDIILLISSDQFVAAAVPFAILVLGAGFSYLNAAFGFASVAVNKQSRLLKISIITLVLNILINLFTIPHFGVAGAATATLITELVACIGVYMVFSRQTGITVQFWPLWKITAAGLAMIPAAWAVGLMHLGLVLHFLLTGAVVAAVYLVLVLVLGALPPDFKPLVNRLLGRK